MAVRGGRACQIAGFERLAEISRCSYCNCDICSNRDSSSALNRLCKRGYCLKTKTWRGSGGGVGHPLILLRTVNMQRSGTLHDSYQ